MRRGVATDPLVKAVLERFPGAEIVGVRERDEGDLVIYDDAEIDMEDGMAEPIPATVTWWQQATNEEKAARRAQARLKKRVKQNGLGISAAGGIIRMIATAPASDGAVRRIQAGSAAIIQRDRDRLRKEARCVNLAYAFLRGKDWHAVEQSYYTIPNTKRIAQIVSEYATAPEQEWKQKMAGWIDGAIKSGGFKGKPRQLS